jgi:hypothetical protein
LTDWGVFSTVAGGATAALLGLLFVAVSIRAEFIARSVELRNRATQTGVLFLTGLLAPVSCLLFQSRSGGLVSSSWCSRESPEQQFLRLIAGQTATRRGRGPDTSWIWRLRTQPASSWLRPVYYCFWVSVYLFAAAVIVVLLGGTANAWLLLVITD